MDYVTPIEIVSDAVRAAEKKAGLSALDLVIRGALSGVFLGYATTLAMTATSQGLPGIVGALIFPVGFVILVLLGLELVTGNFALLPMGWLEGRLSMGKLLRNWTWVYAGNLIGSLLYAYLFYAAITSFGSSNGGALGDLVRQTAVKKTVGYAALGAAGWGTAFVKAILCNWMVTLGAILAFASRSTAGKVLAMWLPITIFFAHGYEHCVVNMFVIPAGMMLKAPVSAGQWWIWNQIPVTLGNILAGVVFTGVALWWTHTQRRQQAAAEAEAGIAVVTAKAMAR
ncbi:MAG TPA: formate/nitrite transporter family protein [Bryobacteraceae bacterium]|jgi:formate/nitrite transporter